MSKAPVTTAAKLHVVVVGSGIIGASIARHLAEAGARVTIIEASAPASAATSKSFAWINANSPETPAYFALRLAALEAHEQGFGPDIGTVVRPVWGGSLAWDAPEAELVAKAQKLNDAGHEAHVIGANEIANLEPNLTVAPAVALYCPREGAIDPVAATQSLLAGATRAGARCLSGCPVTGLMTDAATGAVSGVETAVGPIAADHVVIAAGTASERLLAGVGVTLPMANRRGVIVHTHAVASVIGRVLLSPLAHVRQDDQGHLITGEDFSGAKPGELHPVSPTVIADQLVAALNRLLSLETPVTAKMIMCGERPVPSDGFPLVGPVDAAPGLYLATMHSGITLAPVIGRLVAQELVHARPAPLLEPFRPSRLVHAAVG